MSPIFLTFALTKSPNFPSLLPMKMKWKMSAARAAPPHDWKIAVAAQRLAAHGMGEKVYSGEGCAKR